MYLEHFGLKEAPFGITADTSYAYDARAHEQALGVIRQAIANGEGMVKITGEVGAGKTFLCRRFLSSLDGTFVTAYATCSELEPGALLRVVAKALGIAPGDGLDRHEMVEMLHQSLLAIARDSKTVVFCLDEAHRLPVQTLDTLRLLSDLETEKQKLLHIVLFGQPELDDMLAAESARQVRQRVASECHLGRLQPDELAPYLQRRLSAAGYQGGALFRADSLARLAQTSRGLPRLLNVLAHKCLVHAAAASRREVSVADVRAAARETIDASGPVRRVPRFTGWHARRWAPMPWAGAAAAVVLAAGSAWLAYSHSVHSPPPAIAAAALSIPANAHDAASGSPSAPAAPASAAAAAVPVPAPKDAHASAGKAGIAGPDKHAAATKQVATAAPPATRLAGAALRAAALKPDGPDAPAPTEASAHPASSAPIVSPPSAPPAVVATAVDQLSPPSTARTRTAGDGVIQPVSSPDRAADTYRDAYGAMNQGHTDEAIAGMQLALREDPDYLPARRALSDLLVEQRRLPEARALLAEGLNRDSSRWELALSLARIQVEWGELAPATETLRRSAPYAAGNAAYRGFHAGILERLGRYDEAIGEYGAALRLLPGSGTWWMGMGISLAAVGRTVEARDAFQLARASGNLSPELVQFVEQRLRDLPAGDPAPPSK